MKTTIEQVLEFHKTFHCAIADKPNIGDAALNSLRLKLIREEGIKELTEALEQKDVIRVLDALTDLQYVLDGTYIAFGLAQYKDAAFEEVHRSNMTKLDKNGGVVKDAWGKVMKSDRYQQPNLVKVLFPETENQQPKKK